MIPRKSWCLLIDTEKQPFYRRNPCRCLKLDSKVKGKAHFKTIWERTNCKGRNLCESGQRAENYSSEEKIFLKFNAISF